MLWDTGVGWILLALAVWGWVHSILASLSFKDWVRRRWSAAADRYYRFVYNAFAVVSFLPVLALVGLLPDRAIYALPFPWSLLGLALQGAAVVGLLVSVSYTGGARFLGLAQLFSPDPAPPRLVTAGPYRYVRHPLYSLGLLFLWALPVMTWNTLAFNLGASLYLVVGALFEERKLLREFGAEYVRYRRRTPMLVPGLRLPGQRPE
ncbi:MAG: isoprenylcysteine carboxylmethyltransferase family protein [Chloroflexi bacterium]|nr:isoprenylcysteine carboxylmethyltransferase family protein [Chloroflexota bacterium]